MVPRAGSRSAEAAGHGGAYLPALDGLRAVSILLVVLSHLGLDRVVPGAFGVTLFFFISGFLITRQLAGGLARDGRVDFGGFYWRRVLRLMPAGLVYIAVAGLLFTAAGGVISRGGWLAALGYGANYYDLWAGYRSSGAGVRHPFNILWSLAIEEHFYAVWPVCLALMWGRGRGRVFWALAVLCGAVLVWRVVLWQVCFEAEAWGGWGSLRTGQPQPALAHQPAVSGDGYAGGFDRLGGAAGAGGWSRGGGAVRAGGDVGAGGAGGGVCPARAVRAACRAA